MKNFTISVITPSFNQAEFLNDCLKSVCSQTYQAIEHLVFDPGSTDGSREIAESYPHVKLIKEPDNGQSDALNKAFEMAKGDVIAWINSDDFYYDNNVFERVIQKFREYNSPDIVYGKGVYFNEEGVKLRDAYINKNPDTFKYRFQSEDGILQPALFIRKKTFQKVGKLRDDLHFTMDYEYWIRCMKAGVKFVFFDSNLAIARYHLNNKTYGMRDKSYSEICLVMKEQFGYVNHIWLKRYAEYLAENLDGVLEHSGNTTDLDNELIYHEYKQLLKSYNLSDKIIKLLEVKSTEKGFGDTLREMKKLGLLE
ncbi:MAG: glycosyltransferase [Gammaproteobacteria bacterium]|nr:glycosyltransferase [Gammaproteobacteria bacterium]